jgi:hypothetical protein
MANLRQARFTQKAKRQEEAGQQTRKQSKLESIANVPLTRPDVGGEPVNVTPVMTGAAYVNAKEFDVCPPTVTTTPITPRPAGSVHVIDVCEFEMGVHTLPVDPPTFTTGTPGAPKLLPESVMVPPPFV